MVQVKLSVGVLLCCLFNLTYLRGLSPRANYTDRATAAYRQS
jgi:hypothetical protein